MIEHAGSSEQGPVRQNNEDFIAHYSPEDDVQRSSKGCLFVVSDGVGGSLAGEVASREAAEKLISSYYSNPKPAGRALQEAFQSANFHIYDLSTSVPEYRRMQTTLSAIAIVNNQAWVGHVGDTRIYRVRGGEAKQLTRDHSEVNELVRMQIITLEEARHHPRRNIITRSVGAEPFLQAEFRTVDVELEDMFILCTDGLWEPVEEKDMAAISTANSVEETCRMLTDLALERGTSDNLSIQVVKVVKWEERAEASVPDKSNLFQRALRLFDKVRKGE